MKKILVSLIVGVLSLSLVACGQAKDSKQATTEPTKQEQKQPEEPKKESSVNFPEGQSESGKGKIFVSTPAGTSENGNVPAILVKSDTLITQIGLNAQEMDGSKISYIYINKNFISKEQLANGEVSLDLKEENLKAGTYTVGVIQFDNDQPSGKVVTYHETKYQVKQ
ncbi:hypothetical protein JHL18_01565 [Clostridium sp. YIM B02505]|uniref:Lipoprotein n=1 Tax=Clostridium yunnanense TaxID=2800325 RepID=A0ABS1EIY5_9CLOT|nr:hypothetical protein [Clostridium yunnanense]MBK1809333.1 hypothetical protein [Clostridium yunnanense]